MREYETVLFYEYFFWNLSRLNDELQTRNDNLRFREYDEVDAMESIILLTKIKTYDTIFRELDEMLHFKRFVK